MAGGYGMIRYGLGAWGFRGFKQVCYYVMCDSEAGMLGGYLWYWDIYGMQEEEVWKMGFILGLGYCYRWTGNSISPN
jgi:hypothetical protein